MRRRHVPAGVPLLRGSFPGSRRSSPRCAHTKKLMSTRDAGEVSKFRGVDWRDAESGTAAPLHALNPIRLRYIMDRAAPRPGSTVVDVGCGGGLLAVALAAQTGASVLGVDANPSAVDAARARAKECETDDVTSSPSSDKTTRQQTTEFVVGGPEDVVARGPFDVVCAMEVIEHVSDVDAFVDALAALCRDDGSVFLSTLDKTLAAYAVGIVAAERLFGMLPKGTHDWGKFISPDAVAEKFGRQGLVVTDVRALHYVPPITQLLPDAVVSSSLSSSLKLLRGRSSSSSNSPPTLLSRPRAWLGPFLPGLTPNYVLHATKATKRILASELRQREEAGTNNNNNKDAGDASP